MVWVFSWKAHPKKSWNVCTGACIIETKGLCILFYWIVSFKLYDVDKDGFISKNELEHVMLQLVNHAHNNHQSLPWK